MALESAAGIITGFRQPEIQDSSNALVKQLQLKNLLTQGKVGEFELGQRQKEADRNNMLRDLLANTPEADRIPALEKGGFLNEANILRKSAADAEDRKLANADKVYGILRKAAGSVMANPTLENAIQSTQMFGQITGQNIDAQLQQLQQIGDNPDAIRRWAAGHALEAEKLLPRSDKIDTGQYQVDRTIDPLTGLPTEVGRTQKMVTPDALLTDKRTREEGAANRAVSMRGQNMTDARAREANAVNGGLKAPVGYRFNANGSLEAIPGGPADKEKNPTEGQGKAALYGSRAEEADKILNDLEGKYNRLWLATKQGIENLPFGAGLATPIATALSSSDAQRVDQAQRNFINAVLRQESGAVISDAEFANAKKQYFPQTGEGPEVVAQKAAARKTAIEGLKNMAGGAWKRKSTGASGDFGPPPAGAVRRVE